MISKISKAGLLLCASLFYTNTWAVTDATEVKAIQQEIKKFGHSLVSVSVVEAYKGQNRDLIEEWVATHADQYVDAVLGEQPFDIYRNPFEQQAHRLTEVLNEEGLPTNVGIFADATITAIESGETLKRLTAIKDIRIKRLEIYDIHLSNMNAVQNVPAIWPTTSGTAPNSIIGILDTGIEKSHELLRGKVVSEACFSSSHPLYIDSLCPGSVTAVVGMDAGLPCPDAPICFHGTNMAGMAAASNKEGAGINYSGVAKGAKLASAMIFSTFKTEKYCGKGVNTCTKSNDVDANAALNYMYTVQALFKLIHPTLRLNAVNTSFGSNEVGLGHCTKHLNQPMVSYLTRAGVPVVASSGNNGLEGITRGIGCIPEAVTVGATEGNGRTLIDFSNRDPSIDLYAVGGKTNAPTLGNNYRDDNAGTSGAAASVSGALAILKEKNPTLSVGELVKMLQDTGFSVPYRYRGTDVVGKRLNMCSSYIATEKGYTCGS